ncbi:C4-dicarboxylate transport system C4 -dicarboxylate-binding protein [Niallia circulans]|uniref:TRAP transporter substrate-binding protein n=1 Tax=Shouchella clausii TaxID=79880 RepID=UPI000D938366|nr:TRAP transporter substrate-binding protein [Shouchella clausii]MCM3548376.1 TRAP transporter substrate-binding protein [Shouchella clausii]MCY1103059.1 TRAP transporter substrate-binding protein [Shouchella clausii]MEB5478041.1 TRAP transporter substrate-binding protein [Shouchella clausii]SPU17703.1 C4-dicarboxylate transport system C4 -dicarboxylate-binding protein [Niallia circulans]
MRAFSQLAICLLLLLTGCAYFEASEQEPKMMRIGNAAPDDRSLSQGLYSFAEKLEKRTNGSIKVEVYTNSQLGGDRELFEGMQLNTVQAATISTGPIAQFAPSFNVFDLPFLFPDEHTAYRILDGPIGEELLDTLHDQDVIGINYWENGFRVLSNNIREVATVEDIAGLDIRTLENKWHLRLWQELKANPTPINYGELYIALEQGTVNGQENPVGNIVNSHFYEVQTYVTRTNHIYNASPFMVSKKFWETLTAEEQEAVRNVAGEVQEEQREANQEETETSYDYLEEQGIVVTELSEQAFTRLQQATEPVLEQFRFEYGNELLERIIQERDK